MHSLGGTGLKVGPGSSPRGQKQPPLGIQHVRSDRIGSGDGTASTDDGEVWIDFVADTGDGFNAQYAIARAQAQPRLKVRIPSDLPTGQKLMAESNGTRMVSKTRSLLGGVQTAKRTVSGLFSTFQQTTDEKSRDKNKDNDYDLAKLMGLNKKSKTPHSHTGAVEPALQSSTSNRKSLSKSKTTHDGDMSVSKTKSFLSANNLSMNALSVDATKKYLSSRLHRLGSFAISGSEEQQEQFVTLPRAKYYFHGGDIAYPNPTKEEFLERFFFPYHLALREPSASSTSAGGFDSPSAPASRIKVSGKSPHDSPSRRPNKQGNATGSFGSVPPSLQPGSGGGGIPSQIPVIGLIPASEGESGTTLSGATSSSSFSATTSEEESDGFVLDAKPNRSRLLSQQQQTNTAKSSSRNQHGAGVLAEGEASNTNTPGAGLVVQQAAAGGEVGSAIVAASNI